MSFRFVPSQKVEVVEGHSVRFNTGSGERMSLEREKDVSQMTEQHPSRRCS
jgi:hypothetical protein